MRSIFPCIKLKSVILKGFIAKGKDGVGSSTLKHLLKRRDDRQFYCYVLRNMYQAAESVYFFH